MTETILKLYKPKGMYEQFQRNVQAVKKAPNMVMDCETSFEASFAYSDAQISDHSSMMHQYLLMDKPLLWFMNLSSAMTNEEFIGCEWMEQARRCDEIIAFLEHIRQGEDKKAHLRKKTVERDLPQADGRCGERVCETVWEAMHQEDCMSVLEPS